ncbi:hypothetical protein C2W64_04013 [Brevibacillus laterosporus]|nr:hypothetical protein [Brevibacillus laterosporus]RAP29066.1 hypothetical protein C2W64_04013 [Brevibacillus laterosporus]
MAKQHIEKINETEYTLQHPGMRAAVQMRDRCKNKHGVLIEENYFAELMKHVIVHPKVSWSYFDEENGEDFDELMTVASEFVNTSYASFRKSHLQDSSEG